MRVGARFPNPQPPTPNALIADRLRGLQAPAAPEARQLHEEPLQLRREELAQFSLPFDQEAPTEAELRVAQAQLVGWLEGLFHGIQATLFAQQLATRAQLEELHRKGLPPGTQPGEQRPGTYL